MEVTLVYSFIFIFVIAFKFLLQRKARRRNLPPRPPALPILGHLHLLKKPLHRTLHALSEKYGSVLSLQFGSRSVVVVSSPSAVEECFNRNDIVFANRPAFIMGKYLLYNNTTISSCRYGDHWRNLRRLSAIEIFSSSRLNKFLGIRRDEINILLRKLCLVSSTDFAKVELRPMFFELTFNIIMRMVAGKRCYDEEGTRLEKTRQFRELIEQVFEYAEASNPSDFLPLLQWIDYQGFVKRAVELGKKTDAFLQGLVDEHRNNLDGTESENTMISHMLSLQESQPQYYTDEIIKGFIVVMLLAGTDTAAVTLEWAMSNLLNHPDVMKLAKTELENQLGPDHLLDEPDLLKLPNLQNIISETLRLYPPGPLLVPHSASDDCTVEGYEISRETMLLVNAWAVQRDPRWWDDPTSFKPERFESGKCIANALVPFGLGRRACPGASLAHRELGLTLGSLIQCFEWTRVNEKVIDMTEGKGLSMPKAEPLEAMCKARPVASKISCEPA